MSEVGRIENQEARRIHGMTQATYNYQDPTPEMLEDPMWNAIWDEIKTWNVNVPSEYCGLDVNGNHATAIFLAIRNTQKPAPAPHSSDLIEAARSVVAWFDDYEPTLKGPRVERLRAALPAYDWRDAIKVIPIESD